MQIRKLTIKVVPTNPKLLQVKVLSNHPPIVLGHQSCLLLNLGILCVMFVGNTSNLLLLPFNTSLGNIQKVLQNIFAHTVECNSLLKLTMTNILQSIQMKNHLKCFPVQIVVLHFTMKRLTPITQDQLIKGKILLYS